MPEPDAALVQPDEHVYHLRGTYWRVVWAGRTYRSQMSSRGWTQREALAVAAGLALHVRVDGRNHAKRLHDAARIREGWRREARRVGRTPRTKVLDAP